MKIIAMINLGAALSAAEKKVLLVDADSRSHLTRWLGYQSNSQPTLPEMFSLEPTNPPDAGPLQSFESIRLSKAGVVRIQG